MMIGLAAWMQTGAQATQEWTCESVDACGFIHAITHHIKSISIIESIPAVQILEFNLQKRDGTLKRLVHSKLFEAVLVYSGSIPPSPPTPSPTKLLTGGVRLECFESLFKKCALDWYIEEGDKLRVSYGNFGSHGVSVELGILIGDASITNERRWWAAEDGRLVRPLAPHERALEVGAQLGSLSVVEPYGERNA